MKLIEQKAMDNFPAVLRRFNLSAEDFDLADGEWPGTCLRIGKVFVGVQDLSLRCV